MCSQLAEQYADDPDPSQASAHRDGRSRSTVALIDTLGYYLNAGNGGTGSQDSSQSEHGPGDASPAGYYYGSYGSTTGLVQEGISSGRDYPPGHSSSNGFAQPQPQQLYQEPPLQSQQYSSSRKLI